MSVFANGLEVSGKATPNKTIAAMPDVCLSPPPPPAGPVPIPYPNFGMASDTTDGCTSVFIKGKEAGKKNASKYSKITGDEPATRSFGASVVTHNITGPLKFEAYSFDVMLEGGGAERFTDLTSTNHSNPGSGFSVSAAQAAVAMADGGNPCAKLDEANKEEFKNVEEQSKGKNLSEDEQSKLKSFKKSGTISHSVLDNCGPKTVFAGTSSGMVRRFNPVFSAPATSTDDVLVDHPEGEKNAKGKVKKRVPSGICGSDFTHPRGGMHAHSEPGILENVDYDNLCPDAKMVMNIEWHQAGNPHPRKDACGNCEKVLKAACACIKIVLCTEDGKMQEICPPKKPPAKGM